VRLLVVTGEGTTVHTTVVLPVTSLECVRSLSAYLLSIKILFHAKNSLVKHQRHPSTASSCGGFACVVHTWDPGLLCGTVGSGSFSAKQILVQDSVYRVPYYCIPSTGNLL